MHGMPAVYGQLFEQEAARQRIADDARKARARSSSLMDEMTALFGEADAAGALRCELDQIQDEMLERARARLNARTEWVSDYSEMNALLVKGSKDGSSKDTPSFFLAPWHADDDNEASVKSDCKATIRCYPEEHQHQAEGKACFRSGRPATHIALFARAF